MVCLLIEVPMRSRRRYSFMGYDVTCSSLIETSARYCRRSVYRVYTILDNIGNVRLCVESAVNGKHLVRIFFPGRRSGDHQYRTI